MTTAPIHSDSTLTADAVGIGSTALFGKPVKSYTVQGWYLDSNGCQKTYGEGYQESFKDETQYKPN